MIRSALPSDIAQIVNMGVRFISETPYRGHISVNPPVMAQLVAGMLESPDMVILVLDEGDHLSGMIGMHVYSHPMSGEKVASEAFWWVNPESRGYGRSLLDAAEKWAADKGARKIQMVAPDERVGRFYLRRGYTAFETQYQREL